MDTAGIAISHILGVAYFCVVVRFRGGGTSLGSSHLPPCCHHRPSCHSPNSAAAAYCLFCLPQAGLPLPPLPPPLHPLLPHHPLHLSAARPAWPPSLLLPTTATLKSWPQEDKPANWYKAIAIFPHRLHGTFGREIIHNSSCVFSKLTNHQARGKSSKLTRTNTSHAPNCCWGQHASGINDKS